MEYVVDFNTRQKQIKRVAEELGYGDDILDQIDRATKENQLYRIMTNARKQKEEEGRMNNIHGKSRKKISRAKKSYRNKAK